MFIVDMFISLQPALLITSQRFLPINILFVVIRLCFYHAVVIACNSDRNFNTVSVNILIV